MKTIPPAAMRAAFHQAHAELAASQLLAMAGGDPRRLPSSALERIAARIGNWTLTPPCATADQILAESRRTGRRPSVIATALARRA